MSASLQPSSPITASTFDIEGTWRLLAVEAWVDGQLADPHLNGVQPNGLIHYLSGQRMAVLIAHDGRALLSGDRYRSPQAELAQAAATFTAYAGCYTREGAKLVHHLQVSSFENDVGSDYVRYIELEGDCMWLVSPKAVVQGKERWVRLKWTRVLTSDA
ncbi:lipocalin-like domain-containing protein [Pseudomonas bharatica]|uniref:lipocalin-like domain-containing protein n=1 Tax=Pseudomonas bharatica TaxID=2692112 RepID=UPI003B27CCFA